MIDRQLIYRCPVTGGYYDPLALRRVFLTNREGRLPFDDACAAINESDGAVADIVAYGRAAFDLPPIDRETGHGFTESTVLDVVRAFTGWLAGKDDTAQNLPNSVPCTDCPGN